MKNLALALILLLFFIGALGQQYLEGITYQTWAHKQVEGKWWDSDTITKYDTVKLYEGSVNIAGDVYVIDSEAHINHDWYFKARDNDGVKCVIKLWKQGERGFITLHYSNYIRTWEFIVKKEDEITK